MCDFCPAGGEIAVAQAFGVAVGQAPSWRAAACGAPSFAPWFGLIVALVMGGLVFFFRSWFRRHREAKPPDYPVSHFKARQTVVIVALSLPVIESLSGIAAVTEKAREAAGRARGKGTGDVLRMISWRREYFGLLATAAVEVVVIVALVAIAQQALLSWLEQGAMRATYRPSDPLYSGALLSIGLATVLLPSWGVLQDSGHRIAVSYLARGQPDVAWFALRGYLDHALAPALGPPLLLSGLFAVFAPVVTGYLTERLTSHQPRRA